MSVDEKRDKLNKLLSRKYIEACRYCIYGTRESRRIKVEEHCRKEHVYASGETENKRCPVGSQETTWKQVAWGWRGEQSQKVA